MKKVLSIFLLLLSVAIGAWAQETTTILEYGTVDVPWTTDNVAEWTAGGTPTLADGVVTISGKNGSYETSKTISPTENAIINVTAVWRGRSNTGRAFSAGNGSYFRFGNIVVAQNDQDKKHGYVLTGLDNLKSATTFAAGSYRVEIENSSWLKIEAEINTASNTLTSFTITSEDGATEYVNVSDVVLDPFDYTTVAFGYKKAGSVSTANSEQLKSVKITQTTQEVTKASYTLNYINGELTVKSASGELAVGATVPTVATFVENEVKYFRVAGEPESFTIAEGENNFSVKVREAGNFNYSLLSSLGETLATGSGIEGETVYVGYPHYQLKDGVFYEAGVTNKEFRKSIVLSEDNASATVEYAAKDGVNAVFCVEGENIEGMTENTYGNVPARGSNAKAGVSAEDITITTLPAGKYVFHVGVFTSKTSEQKIYVGYGDNQYAFASSGNLNESASEEVTLAGETAIKYFGTTSSGDAQLDYLWIEKTGDYVPPTPVTYAVNIAAGIENGTVTAEPTEAEEGAEVTLTATPAEGYAFENYTITCKNLEMTVEVSDGKFKMPADEVTVSATFSKIPVYYAVSIAEGIEGGTVTADPVSALEGAEVTLTATPAEGYELVSITVTGVNGNEAVVVTDGKFTMPADDVTVSATFQKKAVEPTSDEEVALTADMFYTWDGYGADASKVSAATVDLKLGESLAGGDVVAGTSTVDYLTYADMTGSTKVIFEGVDGTALRLLMNRQESNSGPLVEKNATIENGKAEISLTDLEYVHINAIKIGWGSADGSTVNSIKFVKPSDPLGVEKEALKDAIAEAKKQNSFAKTEESFAALTQAIADAEAALVATDATTESLTTAKTNIESAVAGLTLAEGYENLTKEMFMEYASVTEPGEGTSTGCSYELGAASGLPYGDGNVSELKWADLTKYDKLIITTAGTILPRLCMNRLEAEGQQAATQEDSKMLDINPNNGNTWSTEKYQTVEDGVYTIDLSKIVADYNFARLHCIKKQGWGEGVVVTGMYLYKAPAPATYAVNIAEGIENGTVTAEPTSAKEGDEVTLTATPAEGYELESITVTGVNGNEAVVVTDNKFKMPADDVTVSATFSKIPVYYAVSIAEGIENGTVTADPVSALEGTEVTLTATPAEGYELVSITVTGVNGNETVVVTGNKFKMPADEVTVSATFKKKPIYIETDLTADFDALTINTNWKNIDGGTAGYTGTDFCPAVTTNAGKTVQVCEYYRGSCDYTGEVLTQTVTGLTPGTYKIELYGGAAYTFGRGFDSEAFSEGTWNAGDKIEPSSEVSTGVTLYAETSNGTYGGELPIYYATNFPEGAAVVTIDGVQIGSNGQVKIGMTKTSKSTNWHVIQLKGVTAQVDAIELHANTVAAANAALSAEENAVVVGEERSALETAIENNSKVAEETAAAYEAAIAALQTATKTFTDARGAYAALISTKESVAGYAEKYVYASAEKISAVRTLAEATPASAADATSKNESLTTALRAMAESHTKAEGVEGAAIVETIANPSAEDGTNGWTVVKGEGSGGNIGVLSNEPWTSADGNTAHKYFDGGNWGASAWDVSLTQNVELGAGKYLLSAIGRASGDVALTLFAGESKAAMPAIGAAGGLFNRGWNYTSVEFVVEAKSTVTIGVQGKTDKQYNWMSFSDFKVVMIESYAVRDAKAELLEAINEAKAIDTEYKDGVEELNAAIADAEGVYNNEEATLENVEKAKSDLAAAVEAFTKANAKYSDLTYTITGQSSIKATIKKGKAVLDIIPQEGWAVTELTVDGADAMEQLADNKLIVNVEADATEVVVTFGWADAENMYEEDEVTGIATIADEGIKVYASGNQICVEGAAGKAVRVYSLYGSLISTATPSENKIAKFTVASGTYVVQVGKKAAKISVK